MASKWSNIAGTVLGYFRLGATGVRLKDSSGSLSVRNADDSSDAVVLPQSLGTGTRDDTKYLRDDGTWKPVMTPNRITEALTIPAEMTLTVAGELILDAEITVDGNVLVVG